MEKRARAAAEGYQANLQALQEEKRQLQTEVEHLRTSLTKSQEKVALLQIQVSHTFSPKQFMSNVQKPFQRLPRGEQRTCGGVGDLFCLEISSGLARRLVGGA